MLKHPEQQTVRPVRPVLKWAGGKSRLLSQVVPALPARRRLVEPFVGGGAVFLGTEFDEYLLADSNPHLIEMYRAVADAPHEFIDLASSYFTEEYLSAERYVEVRQAFNEATDGFVRAAQFLYLNRHGFNGLCRYNKSGGFNVPYGKPSRLPTFPREQILAFAAKASRAKFLHADFAEVMRMTSPGDIVYCDPPYLDRDGAVSFTAYGPNGFGIERQRQLANLAREVASKGIPVVISNHDCATARELYSGAEIRSLSARRSISAAGHGRENVGELLAIFA